MRLSEQCFLCSALFFAHAPGSGEAAAEGVESGEESDDDSGAESEEEEEEAPSASTSDAETVRLDPDYTHVNVDERPAHGHNTPPQLKNFPDGDYCSPMRAFLHLFPVDFIRNVVIPTTNSDKPGLDLTYGQFLRWLGCWFVIACNPGVSRSDFWRTEAPTIYESYPRLNSIISRDRFNEILTALVLTNIPRPTTYKDRFWPVRQLIDEWNKNNAKHFSPGWITCLDESMVAWLSKRTCPGWVFVPRKPHPMGNEYHTIACGTSKVLFRVELVEGKDHPPNITVEHEELGKVPGLLVRLTKDMHGTGRVVVLDSGFSSLRGLLELKKRGLYASIVIKKKRYWPKYIPGDELDARASTLAIGEHVCRQGVMKIPGTVAPQGFYCVALRDSKHVLKLMCTYGTSILEGPQKIRRDPATGGLVYFKYPNVIANYYTARHAVDDNNNLRQGSISLEAVGGTHDWAFRQFLALTAISEVNALLMYNIKMEATDRPRLSVLQFRRLLAQQLVENEYFTAENAGPQAPLGPPGVARAKRRANPLAPGGHKREKLDQYQGEYLGNGEWAQVKTKYEQLKCQGAGCDKRIRTYCVCNPARMLCADCFAVHLSETS